MTTSLSKFRYMNGDIIVESVAIAGAGGETRTPNIQIRSLTLYPVELRPQAENLGRNF